MGNVGDLAVQSGCCAHMAKARSPHVPTYPQQGLVAGAIGHRELSEHCYFGTNARNLASHYLYINRDIMGSDVTYIADQL